MNGSADLVLRGVHERTVKAVDWVYTAGTAPTDADDRDAIPTPLRCEDRPRDCNAITERNQREEWGHGAKDAPLGPAARQNLQHRRPVVINEAAGPGACSNRGAESFRRLFKVRSLAQAMHDPRMPR